MRKNEIKIGEEYAYQRHTYAAPMRVRVLDFEGKIVQGYSYSRRTVAGITIEFLDGNQKGKTTAVTGRQITRTWAEQAAIEKSAAEAHNERVRIAREVAARRANLAARIERVMEAHGEESRPRYVGSHERLAALKAVGFEVEGTSVQSRFDVGGLMAKGSVSEKIAEVLLADSAVAR